MIKWLLYFVAAGLCEIGGGYLVWLWLRENKPIWFALVGGVILILYGVIPSALFRRHRESLGLLCRAVSTNLDSAILWRRSWYRMYFDGRHLGINWRSSVSGYSNF